VKSTSPIVLIVSAVVCAVLGGAYGAYQVSHGQALPVAHATSLLTMPAIGVILLLLAIPVFRYRKALLDGVKTAAAGANSKAPVPRPKRLDPFYAVRVLLLAKSTAVASAVVGGFQLGLVILQLSAPVVAASVWWNVSGVVGPVLSLVAALIVERACKIPDGGLDGGVDGVAA